MVHLLHTDCGLWLYNNKNETNLFFAKLITDSYCAFWKISGKISKQKCNDLDILRKQF